MPTYTYNCEVHGNFDIIHSIKEKLEDCPKCFEEHLEPRKLKRLISTGTRFILNGGRWASTGYS